MFNNIVFQVDEKHISLPDDLVSLFNEYIYEPITDKFRHEFEFRLNNLFLYYGLDNILYKVVIDDRNIILEPCDETTKWVFKGIGLID
jgi:hypothetical protein